MKTKPFTPEEIDSAWVLWQALAKHMQTLWTRYEEPFSERILMCDEDFPGEDFSDDDIPF